MLEVAAALEVAAVLEVEARIEQITAFPIATQTVMLASFAVIARCPACSQLFPVVGNSRSPCPFCSSQLEIVIRRVTSTGEDSSPINEAIAAPASPEPRGFIATFREVLRHPRRFFRELDDADLSRSISRSVGFALVVYSPAVAMHALLLYLLETNERFSVSLFGRTLHESPQLFFALVPITAILFIAYLTTFYQAVSAMASKSRPDLSATIRGTCFGLAPMILAVVPLIGLGIGLAWTLILHAIALRELHGVGRIRAALAVTVPLVVIALRIVYL